LSNNRRGDNAKTINYLNGGDFVKFYTNRYGSNCADGSVNKKFKIFCADA